MIIKKPFKIRDSRVYAYNGKHSTCNWCGYKLQKLWYYYDYVCIGMKHVRPGKKLRQDLTVDEEGNYPATVERPIWRERDNIPDRQRGLPIEEDIATNQDTSNPIGNNHLCSISCGFMYALLVCKLGAIPDPIIGSQRAIRALFRDKYSCDKTYQKRKLIRHQRVSALAPVVVIP